MFVIWGKKKLRDDNVGDMINDMNDEDNINDDEIQFLGSMYYDIFV